MSKAQRRKAETQLQAVLVLADLVAVVLAVLLAYGVRFHSLFTLVVPVTLGIPPLDLYVAAGTVMALAWVPLFAGIGLYRPRHRLDFSTQFELALKGVAAGILVAFALTFFYRGASFSRLVLPMACALAMLLVPLLRSWWGGWFARRHLRPAAIAVVGDGRLARHLEATLLSGQLPGLKYVGRFGDGGGVSDIDAAVAAGRVDRVVLALSPAEAGGLGALVERLIDAEVDVEWVPDVAGIAPGRLRFEELAGVPVLPLGEFPLLGWNGVVKRTMDLALSAIGLGLLSPLFVAIAVAVKLSSAGPVIYRQERIGRDGRRFQMLKFRSMRVDAEIETGPTRTRRSDPRVTGVGRLLRRTSLDELPQLWNVLAGEMSLVGPRPERPALVGDLIEEIPEYMKRHRVKSGMTGYAQVRGLRGADTSMKERILCDLYYIENWSLGLDLRILIRTVLGLFRQPNAY